MGHESPGRGHGSSAGASCTGRCDEAVFNNMTWSNIARWMASRVASGQTVVGFRRRGRLFRVASEGVFFTKLLRSEETACP